MVYLNILRNLTIRLVRRATLLFDTLYFYILPGCVVVFLTVVWRGTKDDGVMNIIVLVCWQDTPGRYL